MKKLIKYHGDKTFMFPNGAIATPQKVLEKFPAILTFTHVIETDEAEEVFWAAMNLSALRALHGIDRTLSESDAIVAIQDIINAPPPPAEPTAEERIAAALEFQVISSLPDATTEV